MKDYCKPIVAVIELDYKDVVTTSQTDGLVFDDAWEGF